jgi:hypothetical protein
MSQIKNLPKTDFSVFRQLIIECLKKFGGKASRQKVLAFIANRLSSHFLPGDLVWRKGTCEEAWRNNASWVRQNLVGEGLIDNNAPRGIWKLASN